MLKKLVLLAVLTSSFHAEALRLKNLGSWTYRSFSEDKVSQAVFQAEGALTPKTKSSDPIPGPAVFIRSLKNLAVGAGPHRVVWQQTLSLGSRYGRPIVKDQLFKRNGRWNYLAEFHSNAGTENMLQSIVFATEIRGSLIVLTYDGHREIYQKQKSAVENLLKNITILPD